MFHKKDKNEHNQLHKCNPQMKEKFKCELRLLSLCKNYVPSRGSFGRQACVTWIILDFSGSETPEAYPHYRMRPVHDSSISRTGPGEGVSGGTGLFVADGGSR